MSSLISARTDNTKTKQIYLIPKCDKHLNQSLPTLLWSTGSGYDIDGLDLSDNETVQDFCRAGEGVDTRGLMCERETEDDLEKDNRERAEQKI